MATERAAETAAEQFGAISRRQLLARDITPAQVRSWIRRGLVHPRHPGVYAWGRDELSTEGELAAALLYAGPGARLASLTALWWQELLGRRPARLHIDVPGRVRSSPAIVIRHPRDIPRILHRGIPVAPLVHSLPLAAQTLTHDSLRLVLARAEFHGLLSLQELEAGLGRGRAGTAAVRAAVSAHLPQLARCANGLERTYVLLCERARLPLPEPNVRIGRYRPDMLWRELRLIVELDGERAHSTPAQRAADAERQAALEALGFRVIRFTRVEIETDPVGVIARTSAAIREPASPPRPAPARSASARARPGR